MEKEMFKPTTVSGGQRTRQVVLHQFSNEAISCPLQVMNNILSQRPNFEG